jgi:hypothetical protein
MFQRALSKNIILMSVLQCAERTLSDSTKDLILLACEHPRRVVDGKQEDLRPYFELVRTDLRAGARVADWRLIYGKILQVAERRAIIVQTKDKAQFSPEWGWRFDKLHEPKLVRVENYHGESRLADGDPFIAFAKRSGGHRYTTVSGVVTAIESYDFGIVDSKGKRWIKAAADRGLAEAKEKLEDLRRQVK